MFCLPANPCTKCMQYPLRPEKGVGTSGTGFDGFEPANGCKRPSPSPLKEVVLLPTGPFLQG